jgi:translation initiation factor IF-3
VTRFLLGKDKVKITIMFRGREVTHPERGTALLDRLAGELAEIAVIEQTPLQDGRNMTMLLAPSKAVLANEKGKGPAEGAEQEPSPNGGAEAESGLASSDGAAPANGAAKPAEASAPAAASPTPAGDDSA